MIVIVVLMLVNVFCFVLSFLPYRYIFIREYTSRPVTNLSIFGENGRCHRLKKVG
jgi:hypothetical protein